MVVVEAKHMCMQMLSLIHIYPSFEQYLDGAECVNAHVVRDGNIITGMGPGAAMEFALAIVDLLAGKEKVGELVEAMCVKR